MHNPKNSHSIHSKSLSTCINNDYVPKKWRKKKSKTKNMLLRNLFSTQINWECHWTLIFHASYWSYILYMYFSLENKKFFFSSVSEFVFFFYFILLSFRQEPFLPFISVVLCLCWKCMSMFAVRKKKNATLIAVEYGEYKSRGENENSSVMSGKEKQSQHHPNSRKKGIDIQRSCWKWKKRIRLRDVF